MVGVWDVTIGRPITKLRGSAGWVSAVAFHPDGRSLVTAAVGPKRTATATLWSLDSGRMIQYVRVAGGPGRGPGLQRRRPQGRSGRRPEGRTGPCRRLDAQTRAVLGSLDTGGEVKFLAFHPDGFRLAVADFSEAKVHLSDLAAGRSIASPGPDTVSCVGFTPDGSRLAAVGYDGDVHLCDARTGQELLVLRGFGSLAGTWASRPGWRLAPTARRIAAHHGTLGPLIFWDLGPSSPRRPGTGDLAGWLCRGRALAEQGDAAGAEAAYDVLAEVPGRDRPPGSSTPCPSGAAATRPARKRLWPGPWSPARRPRALDRPRPVAPAPRLDEGVGDGAAKARSLVERRLSRVPDDEVAAAALAGLFPDVDDSRGWTISGPSRRLRGRRDAHPAARRLGPGQRLGPGRRHLHGRGHDRCLGDNRPAARDHPDRACHFPGPDGFRPRSNFVLDGIRLTTVPESGPRSRSA